jgi:hypothetical protein
MGRYLALFLAVVAGAWIAFVGERVPEPAPLSTPATEFSAERAFLDVEALSKAPHATGSAANAQVRDAVVALMAQMGLSPQVRPGVGLYAPGRAAGMVIAGAVENVVGVLPGRDRTAPAVALMAHYDSVPGSPGAADDLMGVASALEAARAIEARGTPARDVYLVITDGEEAGLLGANAFFRRDPLAHRIGLVINLEARGSSGRVQMFQTSPRNGELIAALQRAARNPAASSLSSYIYENMPNDTDLTEALAAEKAGLNFAILGTQFDYHSPTSTAATLDRGSLQDMGRQALAVAADLAFARELPGPAPSKVYSNLFGDTLVVYPMWAGWIVLAAAAVLIALSIRWARQAGEFPARDILRGVGGLAFATLATVAILEFARRLTGAGFGFFEQRYLLAQAGRWEWAVMLIALGALIASAGAMARRRRWVAAAAVLFGLGASAFGEFDMIGAICGVLAGLIGVFVYNAPASRQGAWAGVLILGLALAAGLQAVAPAAAYVVAWPLLVGAVGAAATALTARRGVLALGLLTILAAAALAWEGGMAHVTYLSMDLMPLFGLQTLTAAFVLWPLAQPEPDAPNGLVAGGLLLILGLLVTLFVRTGDPWTPRYPKVGYVGFLADQDTGKTWRFTPLAGAGTWARQALAAGGAQVGSHSHWSWRRPMLAAPGHPVAAAAPEIGFERVSGGARLTVTPPAGSHRLSVQLRADAAARLTAVSGVAANTALPPGKWIDISWTTPGQPLVLDLRPSAKGRLEMRYVATVDGWPAQAAPLPPRPADVMPWDNSDSTFVAGSRAFAW